MHNHRALRTTAWALLGLAGAVGLSLLLVRDQIARSQRDLFSPHPLRRLAALEYLDGRPATVETALLLRDFLAWERRPMLRRRATALLARVQAALAVAGAPAHAAATEVA